MKKVLIVGHIGIGKTEMLSAIKAEMVKQPDVLFVAAEPDTAETLGIKHEPPETLQFKAPPKLPEIGMISARYDDSIAGENPRKRYNRNKYKRR